MQAAHTPIAGLCWGIPPPPPPTTTTGNKRLKTEKLGKRWERKIPKRKACWWISAPSGGTGYPPKLWLSLQISNGIPNHRRHYQSAIRDKILLDGDLNLRTLFNNCLIYYAHSMVNSCLNGHPKVNLKLYIRGRKIIRGSVTKRV